MISPRRSTVRLLRDDENAAVVVVLSADLECFGDDGASGDPVRYFVREFEHELFAYEVGGAEEAGVFFGWDVVKINWSCAVELIAWRVVVAVDYACDTEAFV